MCRLGRSKRGGLRRTKRENPGEIDNRHTQSEFGNWGNGEYRANGGERESDVRCTGESIDAPFDLEWVEIENYGTDSDDGDYLLNRD